ncbi:MAG: LysM peptidoglycan-binding domain-containing protein [Planctomycetota bacterium]
MREARHRPATLHGVFKRRRLMTVHRKLLLTSLILVGGLAAAWPFRLGPAGPAGASDVLAQPSARFEPVQAQRETAEQPSTFDLVDHPALRPPQGEAPTDAPGGLASGSVRVPASSVVERTVERPPFEKIIQAVSPTDSVSPAANAWPKQRSHIVHNGDTLEKLAERYLADPLRAIEIFDLNRDQLANPHLLPIGAELRIPPSESGAL